MWPRPWRKQTGRRVWVRVEGLGFRVHGRGFRVWVLGMVKAKIVEPGSKTIHSSCASFLGPGVRDTDVAPTLYGVRGDWGVFRL